MPQGEAPRHRTIIESDEPVEIRVGGGYWFKVWHAIIDKGWWASLEPAPAKVLIVLMKHVNQDGICWPGNSLIERESGLGRSAVYAALNQLEAFKLINRRARGYGNRKTIYEVLEPQNHAVPVVRQTGQSRVMDRSTRMDNPAPAPRLSSVAESPPLYGIRSNSEQRIRSTAEKGSVNELEPVPPKRHRPTITEIIAYVDRLPREVASHYKSLVMERLDSHQKHALAKASPLASPLVEKIYELIMSQKGHSDGNRSSSSSDGSSPAGEDGSRVGGESLLDLRERASLDRQAAGPSGQTRSEG